MFSLQSETCGLASASGSASALASGSGEADTSNKTHDIHRIFSLGDILANGSSQTNTKIHISKTFMTRCPSK